MKVTLLYHTPQPERAVARAAKLCYSPSSIDELSEAITEEKAADFVQMLSEIGHESPIEHVSFTFGIEGVSRTLLAQITRHRIASFSVQSQRYVKEGSFDYVIPKAINAVPEARERFIRSMSEAQAAYNDLADILEEYHRETLIKSGVDEKAAGRQAEKLAIEDARFVLPGACETKMIVTMNARSLNNFFKLRCCNRAQWEIRELAIRMLCLVREVSPVLFARSGPKCLTGPCPEGKMSCGKIAQVREFFGSLRGREAANG